MAGQTAGALRRRGKTSCTPGFVAAYLEARAKMLKSGKPQQIEGFRGWKVSRPKEDLD